MCIGIPLRLVSVDGTNAVAEGSGRIETLDLSLVGPQMPGTWVLSFLGAAREVITEDEARLIADAIGGLERVMAGGDLGDAFSDLTSREPALPPHLAAAHAAGKTEA
jgi:hydrogenase expression/formation protein HypC